MAHFASAVAGGMVSPLSRAPLDRAYDTLRLAEQGHGESRRLFAGFEAEAPGLAAVVRAWAARDAAEAAAAARKADKTLRRGDLVVKSHAKRKKARKREVVTKQAPRVRSRADAVRGLLEQDLSSDDPGRRLVAARLLGRLT